MRTAKHFGLESWKGLKGEKRNALARVAAELIQDTSLNEREQAIHHLGGTCACGKCSTFESGREYFPDTQTVRATAVRAIGGYTDNFDSVAALFDDSNPEVKASVVEMLGLHTSEKGARRLIKEALPHDDERVPCSSDDSISCSCQGSC